MSQKTPRRTNAFTLAPTTERLALKRTPLVACMATLIALAPGGTSALELGAASVRSSLGQPLAIEIPYRLAAGEQLAPHCISLTPGARVEAALPTYTRVSRIDISPTHIRIAGDARVVEPLIGVTVAVQCSTAPHFARSYQLFVDPPSRVTSIVAADSPAPPAVRATEAPAPTTLARAATPEPTVAPAATRPTVSARARGEAGGPLAQGDIYTVVRGDTLSGIAARIADRPGNIRSTAEAIFAANPTAFTRDNPDLLEAGRSISIPRLGAAATIEIAAPAPAPATATAPTLPTVESAAPAVPPLPLPATSSLEIDMPVGAESVETVAALPVEPPREAPSTVETAAPSIAAATLEVTGVEQEPATTVRYPFWLSALAAVGAAFLLCAPLLLWRLRRREAPLVPRPDARSVRARELVDPVAGIDVVEERPARTPSNGMPVPSRVAEVPDRIVAQTAAVAVATAPAIDMALDATVDLDIGMPVADDEALPWCAKPTDAEAIAAGDDTLSTAATALLPQAATSDGTEQVLGTTVAADDDERHTLTIVELDMLRQDYEAEHTLTQHTSEELRDAVADLKATQAARAAAGDTATLEMPQQPNGDGQSVRRRA